MTLCRDSSSPHNARRCGDPGSDRRQPVCVSRREFSSLVATLLPRKTRGDLLQTQNLLQLAIAICNIFIISFFNHFKCFEYNQKSKLLRKCIIVAFFEKSYFEHICAFPTTFIAVLFDYLYVDLMMTPLR